MDNGQKLFTKGDKPEAIDEYKAYQLLIAEKLKRHNRAHYVSEIITVPRKMAINYMEFKGKLLDIRSTALKKFDGYIAEQDDAKQTKRKRFSKKFKKVLIGKYCEERDKLLEELLIFVADSKKDPKEYVFERITNNHIKNASIKSLLRNLEKDNEIRVQIRSKTNLKNLDTKLNKYAKSEAKIWALNYVEDHINLRGSFKARSLTKTVDDIYRLMFQEGKYSEIDPNNALKNLKSYVKEATRRYEVVDNFDYILDPDSYYQTIYTSFRNKLKKIS